MYAGTYSTHRQDGIIRIEAHVRFRFAAAFVLVVSCATGEEVITVDLGPDGWFPYWTDSWVESGGVVGPCSQCDDQNDCTRDLCTVGGGCLNENLPMGTDCNDQDACTAFDKCDGAGLCKGEDGADVVHRYRHDGTGAYYYSRSAVSGPLGYGYEKQLFKILRPTTPQTVALYRMLSVKFAEFMLTQNPSEGVDCCGYQDNGVLGHVYPKQQPGTVPLHRLVKSGATLRHISTLDSQEGASDGFKYEYIQGYVCPLTE